MHWRSPVGRVACALLLLWPFCARADEPAAQDASALTLESRSLDQFKLADFMLVSTLDGSLQARRRDSGAVLWTLESPPLVQTQSPPGESSMTWLAEPTDQGGLYYFTEDGGIDRIPASVHDLVDKSPFGVVDNVMYTGSRQTTLYAIDARTGEILHAYGGMTAYDKAGGAVDPQRVIMLGRTEYTLEIHERIGAPAYRLKIASWTPNSRDQDIGVQYTQPLDSVYVTPLSNGTVMALGENYVRPHRWIADVPSLLVRVFDVLQGRDGKLALVNQPPLKFPSMNHSYWDLYVDVTPRGDYAIATGPYYAALLSSAPLAPYCSPAGGGIIGKHTQHCQERRHPSDNLASAALSLLPPAAPTHAMFPMIDPPANPTLPEATRAAAGTWRSLRSILEDVLTFLALVSIGVSQGWLPTVTLSDVVRWLRGRKSRGAEQEEVKKRRRGARGGRRAREARDPRAERGNSAERLTNERDETLEVSDDVLGCGSNGTIVFKGRYQDRDVAVKRLLLDFYDAGSQEVKTLVQTDEHPNIVRYFYKCQSDKFLYIALELCPGTLEHLVEGTTEFAIPFEPLDALQQITLGLQHLHSKQVVHRDIKPQNILVSLMEGTERPKKGRGAAKREPVYSFRYLISDFGLCRKLEVEQSSFVPTVANGSRAGTAGWAAPEIATYTANQDRLTRAVDIFSMGCLFYYALSGGKHPFGEEHMRKVNIERGQAPELAVGGAVTPEAVDLIVSMIDKNPARRPDTGEILSHPLFWSDQAKLDFLVRVSDRLEYENRVEDSRLVAELESHAAAVVGTDWHDRFPTLFLENLRLFRPYRGGRILDLLRALRNKLHHYNDFTPELKECVGSVPSGYLEFYTSRFPELFMTVYHYARENFHDEDAFRQFFA